MPIIKCKMCGGDVVLAPDKTVGVCEYCGSTMTFPKITDEQRTAAFNRGNAFRRAGEFDKALAVYERIVAEDDTDAEAHWCCALCRFGIEWVEDPNTYEYVPTCHRASFDSFLEDVDYLAALEHSDGVTRRQYQKDGARINEVQRGILATSQHEKPFDVFICYKELDDATGERTRDSIDAQEIYYNLTQEGYRVFFSRITLEDKVGTEYEPYIFAALNSAKVMVVLGSKPEYFNAVWVKNEWSRYLTLMHKDRSRLLLPCYKNMDPYDLPDQLSVLMSYDMTKIGFMQDLLRGIRKVLRKDEPKSAVKEPVIIQQAGGPNVDSLLQRAFIFLEDGDWQSADEYCERVLGQAPKTALAYLGKLMVELCVNHREALAEQEAPFDDKNNCQRAIRYGDDALRDELEGYNAAIRKRIEEKRLTGIYNEIQNAAQRARSESEWLALAERFAALGEFRDAQRQAENCRKKGKTAKNAAAFDKAAAAMSEASTAEAYEDAARLFDALPGFRDAEQKAAQCRGKAEEVRRKAEELRQKAEAEEQRRREALEAEEQRRREAKEARAQKKAERAAQAVAAVPTQSKKPLVFALLAVVVIAAAILAWKLPEIRQERAYKQAVALLEAADFEAAGVAFSRLGDYKDSGEKAAEAAALKIEADKTAAYEKAEKLMTEGDYAAAFEAFAALGDYRDSAEKVAEAGALKTEADNAAAYAQAEELLAANDYRGAILAFSALGSYQDSHDRAGRIYDEHNREMINSASVGDTVFFGSYEQDSDKTNGQEIIEWLVLAKEGDRILVVSKYALDCQLYKTSYRDRDVTWETCSLRKWLNGEFLNAAFSVEEQAMIPTMTVSADENPSYSTSPGKSTEDQVFLLSIPEANRYFSSNTARQCEPTAYAKAQECYANSNNGFCWWWLRSPGGNSAHAAGVESGGSVNAYGNFVWYGVNAVRPALWIELGD